MISLYVIKIVVTCRQGQTVTDIWQRLPSERKTNCNKRLFTQQVQSSQVASSVVGDSRLGEVTLIWADNPLAKMVENEEGSIFSPQGANDRAYRNTLVNGPKAALSPPAGVLDKLTPLVTGETSFAHGIIHLYRDPKEFVNIKSDTSKTAHGSTSAVDTKDQTILCVLSVPAYMTPSDFLNFAAPVRDYVSHFRLLRDTSAPNKFMVLLKFRDPLAARDFYKQYNGRPFNSMEPEICHVVYVKSVEIHSNTLQPYAFPVGFNDSTPPSASGSQHVERTKVPAASSTTSLQELPTCPVCLERMDSNVTGLLTILCQHTFHCNCLSKWADSRCPVCRYTQSRTKDASTEGSVCAECAANQNLWICLICGHIGCGRYNQAHAFHHYADTSHLYALELETQRVWDYAGDGYVHRLIQNKTDGKLVELPHPVGNADGDKDDSSRSQTVIPSSGQGGSLNDEKLDAIGVEYSYLLTSQLESQRTFYEEKLSSMYSKIETLERRFDEQKRLLDENKEREISLKNEVLHLSNTVIPDLLKDKKAIDEKLERAKDLSRKIQKEWRDEKAVSASLMQNLETTKAALKEKEDRVTDLEEQLKDMMFFLDAREKIGEHQDGVGGSIVIQQQPETSQRRRRGRK